MTTGFFGLPHLGGTYSVFRTLRPGLAARGIGLRWIGTGAPASRALLRSPWASEMARGTVVAPQESEERSQAAALLDHIGHGGYDAVFVNVLADRVQTNAVRYLDRRVLRVMVVHNITPATYAAATAIRDWVHATVCVSPRIRDDLVARHGFAPERTHVILNAILPPMAKPEAPRGARPPITTQAPLRLLSLGRVEDASKGVLWLPRILRRLDGLPCVLTVGGDGPDLENLRRDCARFGRQVRFLGAVPAERVAAVMAEHDVLVFPSRFEGFGLTLAEAMAAGCVPVASAIRGVTDAVVDDGRTGLLFPVGAPERAALAIQRLIMEPGRLERLSSAARLEAARRFDAAAAAGAYADLLQDLRRHPPAIADPLPLARWRYPGGLGDGGLRRFVPHPIKNLLRMLRERSALALAAAGSGRPGERP
ncbi:glycosyltransferase family 4 protein [Azospirillum picis]|uniref:Glycosyltransferase involved in cell wall biosynthesis n=1 Tax=Azospirillum picis TaxID=488438 RepID=A0ABU0MRL9_9PROT|nr:glycosyltransferase family 4 protein [Azospirillum picis]MBP2300865.1 glycosyltransferase involved in cell wall biosynthesis [Azospirillum picis]MDQ0536122.1 glycosyltransferase involved in cell wall biosynthesis [Azospirillum picis]